MNFDWLDLYFEEKNLVKFGEMISSYTKSHTSGGEKPIYKHDCDNCDFLCTMKYGRRIYDLYACEQEDSLLSIIARYSDSPSSYYSGIPAAHIYPFLFDALDVAVRAGIAPFELIYPVSLRSAIAKNDVRVLYAVVQAVNDLTQRLAEAFEGAPLVTESLSNVRKCVDYFWTRLLQLGIVTGDNVFDVCLDKSDPNSIAVCAIYSQLSPCPGIGVVLGNTVEVSRCCVNESR